MKHSPITLQNVCAGAAEEVFQHELQKALENISDPNTDPEQSRTITLQFKIHPFKDRTGGNLTFSTTTKLANVVPTESPIFLSKEDGTLRAYARDTRQDGLFDEATGHAGNVVKMEKTSGA